MKILSKRHQSIIETLLAHFKITDDILMLSEKEVYKKLLFSTGVSGIEKVYDYMTNHSDFFVAPASTRFHGNYEGGLAVHELIVLALLIKKNEEYELGLTDAQCVIAALAHDLCKCNFYTAGYKNTKVYCDDGEKHDAAGNFTWKQEKSYSVEDKFPLGHGNKSLYILMNYIAVDAVTAMLISWHMGAFANTGDNQYGFNNACDYNPAVAAMHSADAEASSIFEIKIDKQYVD